jgi:hypothetical protein
MRTLKLLTAAAIACALSMTAQTGAGAAPLLAEPIKQIESGVETDALVQKVGHRHRKYKRYHGGITYVGPHGLKYAPSYKRHRHRYGSGVSVTIHVGPRHHRVYRRHTKPWIYDVPRRVVRSGMSVNHYRWCDTKYRSYRYSDDTFQPYHGPRKRCRSPFGY